MPIGESVAVAAATAVMKGAAAGGVALAGDAVARRRVERALAKALTSAAAELELTHRNEAAALFDGSFIAGEAAPLLSRVLDPGASLTAADLAAAWADSLGFHSEDIRRARSRELEPACEDFLRVFERELAKSGTLENLVKEKRTRVAQSDLRAIREALAGAEPTSGTLTEYLDWVCNRYSHVDPRGIAQTQRQIQVPLDEVYVRLTATAEHDVEEELAESAVDQRADRDSRDLDIALALADQRSVLLGDPGSGKSTILRYLALSHARGVRNASRSVPGDTGPPRVPILIRVADYAESGLEQPLSEFLLEWHRLAEAPTEGLGRLFDQALASGDALVLLDGLDEVIGATARQLVVKRIDDFSDRHAWAGNRFVVTSRIAGYRERPLSPKFKTFRIRPMDEEQVFAFLRKWCYAVERSSSVALSEAEVQRNADREVDGIASAIAVSQGVRRLATSPLLLTILTLIHRTGAELPQRRIALYDLAVATLARTWRRAQGVPDDALVDETLLTRVLSSVAYWLHKERDAGVARLDELRPVIEARWAEVQGIEWKLDSPSVRVTQEVEDFLMAVRVQTGLLVERAPEMFGFMHLTFEEYYAARHLVSRSRSAASRLREHLHQPRWEEPILLALGFVGLSAPDDAAELVDIAVLGLPAEGEEGFGPSTDEELLGRDLLFALRCMNEMVPLDPHSRRRLLGALCRDLLTPSARSYDTNFVDALLEAASLFSTADAREAWQYVLPALGPVQQDQDREQALRLARVLVTIEPALAADMLEVGSAWPADEFEILVPAVAAGVPSVVAWVRERTRATPPDPGPLFLLMSIADDPAVRDEALSKVRAALVHDPLAVLGELRWLAPSARTEILEDIHEALTSLPEAMSVADRSIVTYLLGPAIGEVVEAPGVLDALLRWLSDACPVVRWCATGALEESADHLEEHDLSRVATALCEAASSGTGDADEIWALLDGLETCLSPSLLTDSVRVVLDEFIDHADEGLRVVALDVLLWDRIDVSTLRRAIGDGLAGDGAARFMNLAPADPPAFARVLVEYVEAAGPLADPEPVRYLCEREDGPPSLHLRRVLAEQLDSNERCPREVVARVLARSADDAALRSLLTRVKGWEDPAAPGVLAQLALVGTPAALELFELEVAPPPDDWRWGIATAMVRGASASSSALRAGLSASGTEWQAMAVTLISFGPESEATINGALEVLLSSNSSAIDVRAASDALERLGREHGGEGGAVYSALRARCTAASGARERTRTATVMRAILAG